MLLFAIEPPDDDTQLIMGVEKPTRHPLTGNRLRRHYRHLRGLDSDHGAADKAINRWLKAGRIAKKEGGLYELGNG